MVVFINVVVLRRLAVYSTTHPDEVITREIIEQLTFNPYVVFWGQGLGYAVLVGVMVWMVRTRHRRPFWQSLRWNWPKARAPLYIVAGIGLAIVMQFVQQFLPMPKSLPMERYFETPEGAYLMAVFGTFIAPPAEEFFFRGFLYPVLARWFARSIWRMGLLSEPARASLAGTIVSVVLTAASFALIHSPQLAHSVGPLAVIFTVGLVITAARAFSGSLSAGLLIHMAYNATLFVLLYLGTDGFRHLERMS
jgi:CAAX protease family protein